MAEVRLIIGMRHYMVACSDGEEAHLYNLGRIVAEKVKEAEEAAGGLNESRGLLFASLLLADALADKTGRQKENGQDSLPKAEHPAPGTPLPESQIMEDLAIKIENLASRIESFADRLERE